MQENDETNQSNDPEAILLDYNGRTIRLNSERYAHIMGHPEMSGQFNRIAETLSLPNFIVATLTDPSVHVYNRLYLQTPVTRKYMLVAVKIFTDDAFVLTAFFSSRSKKGIRVWPP
jgi:hypothetical protein